MVDGIDAAVAGVRRRRHVDADDLWAVGDGSARGPFPELLGATVSSVFTHRRVTGSIANTSIR